MKCLCGYEKLHDWEENKNDKEIGVQDFIRIDYFGQPFETDLKTNREHGDRYEYGYLYACPKCMTIKLAID